MTTEELIYKFQLKGDKLDGKNFSNIQLPAMVYFLNEGMMALLMKRYSGTNTVLRAAFEEIQKRKDEFQRLLVTDEIIKAVKVDDEVYTADLNTTKRKYMFLTRCNMFATKGKCIKRKMNGILTETDDLDEVEGNPQEDSSFEWGDCIYRQAEDKIRMRSDGTFKITSAKIDYLRYPVLMDFAGYKHFDGTASTTVNCELPEFMHDDIVDEALFAYSAGFAAADVQIRMAKMRNNE